MGSVLDKELDKLFLRSLDKFKVIFFVYTGRGIWTCKLLEGKQSWMRKKKKSKLNHSLFGCLRKTFFVDYMMH